ncbi:MAG: hypothetical protein LBK44_01640 [Spirochaetales bacterium]|nr:hypothetical protein [Spirochaetales bacterium]
MQILWAFHFNPLREWQLRTSSRNCRKAIPGRILDPGNYARITQAGAIVEQLRELSPSFFAVRRKKTRLYHQPAATHGLTALRLPLSLPPGVVSRLRRVKSKAPALQLSKTRFHVRLPQPGSKAASVDVCF